MMKLITVVAACAALLFTAGSAFAQENPCGKFDFTENGFNCKIETEGGCTAQCTPLSFKAGCKGGCTATATQDCTGTCGTQCLAECNPELLDCFQGCHAECDAEVEAQCEAENMEGIDCREQAVAQCDLHCEDACEVPPSNCQDHCISCCNGGCTTQVNFGCDFDCFAELKGGCEVQCTQPKGALFCNDQYVYASDIDACIQYLLTQGIEVDVSAQGSLSCENGNCDLDGALDGAGCAYTPASEPPDAEVILSLLLFAGVGGSMRRRRRNKQA